MKNLLNLFIALAIVVGAFFFVSSVIYLLTDADFTYKMVIQTGATLFLTMVLSVIAISMYFWEEEK